MSADVHHEHGEAIAHVGDSLIALVDVYESRNPAALLDAEDADLGHIASTIFDAIGELADDFDQESEPSAASYSS